MGQPLPIPTISNFKAMFGRDFKYGTDLTTVRDQDIAGAMNLASTIYNPCLFSTQPIGVPPFVTTEALQAYLYVSAHFLVTSLMASGGLTSIPNGFLNSQGEGVTTSKGAGGISMGMSYPSWLMESPALFQLTKTTYGQLYLQMLMPRLVGNIAVAGGYNDVTGPGPGGTTLGQV